MNESVEVRARSLCRGVLYRLDGVSCDQGEGDSGAAVSMDGVLAALAQMSLGGSGGSAGGDEPRDDKPRLLCVEPAPPRPAPQVTTL